MKSMRGIRKRQNKGGGEERPLRSRGGAGVLLSQKSPRSAGGMLSGGEENRHEGIRPWTDRGDRTVKSARALKIHNKSMKIERFTTRRERNGEITVWDVPFLQETEERGKTASASRKRTNGRGGGSGERSEESCPKKAGSGRTGGRYKWRVWGEGKVKGQKEKE